MTLDTLDMLRIKIVNILLDIEDVLPEEYRLTLLARHAGNKDAQIVITRDDLTLAVASLSAVARQEAKPKKRRRK